MIPTAGRRSGAVSTAFSTAFSTIRVAPGSPPATDWRRAARRIGACIGLTTLCWTGSAGAEDLAQVLDIAQQNDPVLAAARSGYEAQRQTVPQARSSLLPSLIATGNTSDNRRELVSPNPAPPGVPQVDKFNDHGYTAQLRQPILNLASWYTYTSTKALVEQAEWDLAATAQNLLVRTAEAYLNVLRAQDLLESSQAQETAVKRQLEQVQQRFDVGLVAITDVLESTAIYDDAVVQRIQADGDHDNSFNSLTTLTGESFVEISKLSGKLPVVPPEPRDVEAWVQSAYEDNLGIRASRARLESARRTLRARRADFLPTIDATATRNRTNNGSFSFFGAGTQTQTDIFALEMSLPIYQGGFRTARAREARALFKQAASQLEERLWTANRDVRNLYRAVTTDVVRVQARLKAIRSSESALEATQTGYEVGTRNIVDVLQAQQRLYAAQFNYADSRYSYVLNLLRLKQAAGTLDEQDLMDVNSFIDQNDTVRRLASLQARSAP
ncbi:MAG: TolC family outer membrane protein [Pseudomonadota bacterium]